VAVHFDGTELTYRELDARSNQLARHLRSLGIGVDDLVGVCLERSLQTVIALVAVVKAGAANVPIAPSFPPKRVVFMVADSRVLGVLTEAHVASRLPAHGARTVELDTDWVSTVAKEDPSSLPRAHAAKNLAYAIYTSGSTGKPKAAMNTHEAICNRLLWMQAE